MKQNPKLSYAILLALGANGGVAYAAADTDTSVSGIDEIVVTAQRRTESIQDVPITIQAISGEQLKQLSIASMDDLVRYTPNVTFPTNGPGQGNIFMRGLSAGSAGNQSQSSIAAFPSVAVYLDDQSVQFPGRNLDILAIDLARIEVLEGPQGTLFGGGAEAGAIRYITNKPKLGVTEGIANASYGTTAHGDPNSSADITLNLPFGDNGAVRATVYTDRRGGYIDNVGSTFARANTDVGTVRFGKVLPNAAGICPNGLPTAPNSLSSQGYCLPANGTFPSINNLAIAKPAQNPVDYSGFRLSAFYKFNDDWNILLQQSYQSMEADGVFTQFPIGSDGTTLQRLQVTSFSPAWDKDKFENTSWTLNGKVGLFDLVYTGGYLVRNTEQVNDYTNYARGFYGDYYQCTGGSGTVNTGVTKTNKTPANVTCYTPASSWHDKTKNTHQTHEIRLSTPTDWQLRGLVGAFYEDFKIFDVMDFNYLTVPTCTQANLNAGVLCVGNAESIPGSTITQFGQRGDTTAFGEDLQRGYKQKAVFASADYDIIPKVLTATIGARYYRYSEFETGSEYYTSTGCAQKLNPCGAGVNINAENLAKDFTGVKKRANLSWHITPDTLAYYTFSEGYRPGAFNRTSHKDVYVYEQTASGAPILDSSGKPVLIYQYIRPTSYGPDKLQNQEVGIKSEFLDRRVQVNASYYRMKWDDVQVAIFNPGVFGNTTFGNNGPNYNVNGFELQLVARVTDGLTLSGNGSWNTGSQQNTPCVQANNPAIAALPAGTIGPAAIGTCITQAKSSVAGQNVTITNALGQLGGTPANSPKAEFSLRARYDWKFDDYKAFASVGATHTGNSFSQLQGQTNGDTVVGPPTTTILRYEMPAYTLWDASFGLAKDSWTAEVYGQNLGDSNASVFTSSAQFIKAETPVRPRVLGVKIGYKF